MRVWAITLAVTYVLCAVANQYATVSYEDGYEKVRSNRGLAAMACIILILVSGLRQGVGDTGAYKHSFSILPDSFSEYLSTLQISGDWGFNFISMLIKEFIADDGKVMIFIMSFITILCVFIGLWKYSCSLELAVFLFITSGGYLTSMNGVRQYLASAVIFLAMPLIYKRKWYFYFPIVVIMSQIHSSAYAFILLYFVVNCKAWGRATIGILIAGIGLYLTYGTTGPMIASLLQESQYGAYSDALVSTGAGANIVRVVVMAVPVLLSYLGRDILKEQVKYYDIITNFSVINLVFILLANKYWIYARMNMYFTLYMVLLLCECLRHIFEQKSKKIVYLLCLICYGFYYWYEMYVSLGFREGYIHFIKW